MINYCVKQIFLEKISAIQDKIPIKLNIPSALNNSLSFKQILDTESSHIENKEFKRYFDTYISNAADKYRLPPALIESVIQVESGFNHMAVSRAGAQGLMQLMPLTAKQLGVTDSFDPEQNIDGGARYLRQMLDQHNGDLVLALAAYNAGPGNVEKFGGIPPFSETRNYIKNVLNYYQKMQKRLED